jgi:transposase
MDNSSVHVNDLVKDLIAKNGIKVITIPAYSPQFNASEKVIAAI